MSSIITCQLLNEKPRGQKLKVTKSELEGELDPQGSCYKKRRPHIRVRRESDSDRNKGWWKPKRQRGTEEGCGARTIKGRAWCNAVGEEKLGDGKIVLRLRCWRSIGGRGLDWDRREGEGFDREG